mgnify:CR=1 FL=1
MHESNASSAGRSSSTLDIFKYSNWIAIAILVVVFSIMSPNFLSQANVINVARSISETAIMAAGTTLILLAGEMDLSMGSWGSSRFGSRWCHRIAKRTFSS